MKYPRMKFLERGFGIRKKLSNLRHLIDQRRLDGTRTRAGEKTMGRISNFIQRSAIEPIRVLGKKFHAGERAKEGKPPHYTLEEVARERKKNKE